MQLHAFVSISNSKITLIVTTHQWAASTKKKKKQSICQAKQQNSIQRLMLKWLDFYLRSKSHRPIGYRRAKAARINSRHFRQFPKAQNADRQNSVRRAQERTNEKNCCGFRNPKCGCTFDFFCLSSWQKITVCFWMNHCHAEMRLAAQRLQKNVCVSPFLEFL